MHFYRSTGAWAAFGLAAVLAAGLAGLSGGRPPEEPGTEEGVEPLAHGPIHEAFGKPVNFDPEPGILVSKQPPEPIEEAPPEEAPEGENIVWIPGYWGWDDAEREFIWVSGFWREPPPGRRWVPGYWQRVERGYEWVSGFWAPLEEQEVTYLPEPPQSVEAGPSTEAPAEDHEWAPGCWVWRETRYAWRPGFWVRVVPDWVWVPAHYVWTPSGCVFIDGHFDHAPHRRGLLFAPVRVHRVALARPRFVYTPRVVVNVRVAMDHFFVFRQYHHYCFGDYYAPTFVKRGIYPSFAYHQSHYGYSPIFAHLRVTVGARDPQWVVRQRETYLVRRDREDARPPRTFAAAQTVIKQGGTRVNVQNVNVVQTINQYVTTQKQARAPVQIRRIDKEQRTTIVNRVKDVRKVVQQRSVVETKLASQRPAKGAKQAKPVTAKLPQTALASRPVKELSKKAAPPPPPKAVKVDTTAKVPQKPAARPRPEEILKPGPVKGKDVVPPKVKEKPEPPKVKEKPVPPKVKEKPEPPKVKEKPEPPKVKEKPEPPKVKEKPVPPKVKEKPEPPKVKEKPEPPKVKVKPEPVKPKVKEKPEPVRPKVKEKPEPVKPKVKDDPDKVRPKVRSDPDPVRPRPKPPVEKAPPKVKKEPPKVKEPERPKPAVKPVRIKDKDDVKPAPPKAKERPEPVKSKAKEKDKDKDKDKGKGKGKGSDDDLSRLDGARPAWAFRHALAHRLSPPRLDAARLT